MMSSHVTLFMTFQLCCGLTAAELMGEQFTTGSAAIQVEVSNFVNDVSGKGALTGEKRISLPDGFTFRCREEKRAGTDVALQSDASVVPNPIRKPDENRDQSPGPRLICPKSIPAVVGVECNLYFDNVVLIARPDSLLFDAVCAKGRQQVERWTWVPTEADVGSHPFELVVRDENNQRIATASCTINVVSNKKGEGKALTMLMIGDSLTHSSVYPQRVIDQSTKLSGPNLSLIGSHIPTESSPKLRHEGYGGWTARRFATYYSETARTGPYGSRGSPFLYKPGTDLPRLDFSAYCRDINEGRYPDVVSIFLGPNDIFSYDDDSIEKGIDDMLSHLDELIKMISATSPSTRIGLMLPVPPAASQDAFGANYGSGQTRWQYRRNQHRLVERMFKHYVDRTDQPGINQRLSLVPTYLGLDCVHNYPTETIPVNAATGTTITRQNNGVHPASTGYDQIGDILFAWLKSQTED